MSSTPVLTPARRDAIAALVAVALIAGPVWASALHLAEPSHRYERVEITTDGGRGIGLAGDAVVLPDLKVSDRIRCVVPRESRICAFEEHLAEGRTVATDAYSAPNRSEPFLSHQTDYDYVVLGEEVYETSYVVNESARSEGGSSRIDLALEPIPPETALEDASIDATEEPDRVPDPVLVAARTGSATTHRDVDVPEEPIEVDGGRYYRVYQTGPVPYPEREEIADGLLTYVAPLVGVLWLRRLLGRVEVEYVGDEGDAPGRHR